MAKIMTFKVLYEDQSVESALMKLIASHSGVIDCHMEETRITHDELDDSIANDTYAPMDAFSDWVLFNIKLAKYWSDEIGWTDRDKATRFKDAAEYPDTSEIFGDEVCYLLDTDSHLPAMPD